MTFREEARELPIYDSVDVLVAGGGIAGCAAAAAAARAGAKTMLVERNGCLGGVLTSNIIPNLLNAHIDEAGEHQVSGIPLEVIRMLVERGGCVKDWNKPYAKIVIDEQKLKVVLIELLQEAGVTVLTHVLAAAPIMENRAVKGLFIETKVGRMTVLAKAVVDCTGEADIASRTGCPMRITTGTSSLAFKMSGVDGDAFCAHFRDNPDAFPANHDGIRGFEDFRVNWEEYGDFYFPHRGGRKWPLVQEAILHGEYSKTRGKAFGLDMLCLIGMRKLGDVSVNSMLWRLPSLEPHDLAEAELETQKLCYYIAEFMQKRVPGFENAHVSQISQDLGIRVSRGIEGEKTLTIEHATSPEPVYFDDVIGLRSAKPWGDDGALDHPFDADDKGEVGERSVNGETTPDGSRFLLPHTVDLPYGMLLPKGVENLLVGSGKTVSSVPQTTLRCGTNSMQPGQAAGVAAAVAVRAGVSVRNVDIRTVQKTLVAQGVYLGPHERLVRLGLV